MELVGSGLRERRTRSEHVGGGGISRSGPGHGEESREVRIMDRWVAIAKNVRTCSGLVVS